MGIESRWERDFPHPSRPALGPTQPPIQRITGLSWGVKRQKRGVDHPPPSSAEAEERVELYLYSPSGPSRPVLGRTLPLPLPSRNNLLPTLSKKKSGNFSFYPPQRMKLAGRLYTLQKQEKQIPETAKVIKQDSGLSTDVKHT